MTDQLTAAGLEIDDFQTRLDDLLDQVRAEISPIIDGSADSSEGQFLRIFTERTQALAELLQAIHGAQYPDGAIGFSLTALSRLTGTERRDATYSTAYCRVNVDPGTYLAGTLVASVTGDPTARFVNSVAVVNGGGGAANVDNVLFTAEQTGPVAALDGTLVVIAEPVSGWNSVTNAPPGGQGDAVEGEDEETDAALRQRRQSELQTGSTAVGAILSTLTQLDSGAGVVWAAVLENDTDLTDANGLPPHSVAPVVHLGTSTAQEVAEAVFGAKAGGIQSWGTASADVEDSQQEEHRIGYSLASVQDVYLEIDVDVDGETYDGDSAVETQVANWGDTSLGVGEDVVLTQIIHTILDNIAGVVDVTAIRIGLAPSPVGTSNLVIAWNELADLDTGRIDVTSTEIS